MNIKALTQADDSYYINSKVCFGSRTKVICSSDDLGYAIKFRYDMTFGKKGEHRDNCSGGNINRNLSQQFSDILIGLMYR